MILVSYGTRPEYIKLKPVIDLLKENNYPTKVLFTGQHLDLLPSNTKDLIDIELKIEEGPHRLDSIVESTMNNDFIFEGIKYVMVQGDTTSAFSIALAGFHRNIPVIHLEAGLRTYDNNNPFPEEFNRQAISRMASTHLCPTILDYNNLVNEKSQGQKYVVGNTVLDNLKGMDVIYNNKVLITMHRRENHEKMDEWFKSFEEIAAENPRLNFIFISHPNPNVQKHLSLLKNVEIVDPIPYNKFIEELAACRFVITDSGGIQEESSFLRKKSIVCRHKTERISGVGTFSSLCLHPEDLKRLVNDIAANFKVDPSLECPYGTGHSAEKIFNIIKEMMK
jgi:UDP-N-acetylglucosamine 2-epimerase (non-hydrolysing)